MDIIGKWKVVKVGVFDEDEGMQVKTLEEVMAMEETDEIRETKEMAQATFLWITAKTIQMRLVVAPEMIEEARAEGEEVSVNKDGSVTVQRMPWKEEDGKILCKMGEEGEIDGEEVDPWQVVELDENGVMTIGMMSFVKE
ncbi:MAG: hypothetical protein J6R82_06180 [Clostridia bacterium]|nr:hypothetical protein [Clostridia bacterium]